MTRHNVRLVFVDGDEGSFEVDDNGTSPQSTFETKGGKTYPIPETASKAAHACVMNVVGRFCNDPGFGVPSVREVYADRGLLEEMFVLDDLCAQSRPMHALIAFSDANCVGAGETVAVLGEPYGSRILGVAFFTPEGTRVLPLDRWIRSIR